MVKYNLLKEANIHQLPESTKSKPIFQLTDQISRMKTSATLEMNQIVRDYRRAGAEVVNFGLGQSPFGPPKCVMETLQENAHRTDYLPTNGIPQLREEIAGFYNRKFDIDCKADQVVVGPGSKELIFNSMLALNSPWLFLSPSWVSYETQTKMIGRKSWRVFASYEEEFRISEQILRKKVELIYDMLEGHTLAILINYPNNPTGMTLTSQEVRKIARFARNNELILLSDEIYANITHSSFGQEHHSLAKEYPEGTIVTGGISKDRSMGGYRLGTAILPEGESELIKAFQSIGSETFSSVAAPIQYAAVKAYEDNSEVDSHIKNSTDIHEIIGSVVYEGLSNGGYKVPRPEGGFYLLPSLNHLSEKLNDQGIFNSKELVKTLIAEYGVAVIAGTAFSLRPHDFSIRLAYIDYPGPEVMEAYVKDPDDARRNAIGFVEENCPNILRGIKNLQEFVYDLD